VERLGHSLIYDKIYPRACDTLAAVRAGVGQQAAIYNEIVTKTRAIPTLIDVLRIGVLQYKRRLKGLSDLFNPRKG